MLDITRGMVKKVIHFNSKTPSFYNKMYTQIFHEHISIKMFNKSTISFVARINYYENLGDFYRNL